MNFYCNNPWKVAVEKLGSNIQKGLREDECATRRKYYGNNKINLPYGNKGVIGYVKGIASLYMLINILIASLLIYSEEYIMGIIVFGILVINIIFRGLHLYNKKKQVEFLQNINYTTVSVIRDGVEKLVKAEELVVGDIVFFRSGSLIAADMRVIRAHDIKVDEKNITGETFLKDKYESKIDGNISSVGEMKNILFKGSIIRDGEGAGIVISTGENTQLGKLLAMLNYANNNKHTLGKKITSKVNKIYFGFIGIIALLSIVSIGQTIDSLLRGLFILGILPVEFITYIYVRILKGDLNREGIELINVSTLDLINELEILFLDKIGSITSEKMVVSGIYSNNQIYNKDEVDYKKDININRLMDIILLCNNATYNITDDTGKGDLCEVAYLSFAAQNRIYKSLLDGRNKRIFEVPMDSDKRMLTTLNKSKKGYRANVKGDVDAVLDRCTHIMVEGVEKELTDEEIERVKAVDFNFSIEGLKTQGIAYRSFNYQPSKSENIESNLVFVGIIALENPFNEDVDKQIAHIRSRGIVPILFTDDNKITATVIGQKAGIVSDNGSVISGVELDSLTGEELIDVLSKTKVFSRVNPEIKGKIVGLFSKDGYGVGASGETLGDLSSLSISKVGIGKGKAPEIVKKVSDVFIRENYLNKFLMLFDVAKEFKKNLESTFKLVISTIFAQGIILSIMPLILGEVGIDVIPLLLINALILLPLLLATLIKGMKKESIRKTIIRTSIWTLIPLISSYMIKKEYDEVFLMCFGFLIISHVIFNISTNILNIDRGSMLISLSIVLWIISISLVGYIGSVDFTQFEMIKLAALLISYVFIELTMRIWKV